MVSSLAALMFAVSVDAAAVEAAVASGDAHFAHRAEGAAAGVARPAQTDAAIADYRRAIGLDPTSLDARLKLLRAYFFRGGFCGASPADSIDIFTAAKDVAEDTVKLLDSQTGRSKSHIDSRTAGAVPVAAEVYLWAAVSWGQWAVSHPARGAWQHAPARIRDLAEAAVAIDPAAEQAGGHVVLGRLHTEAPRVPFLTHWVDRTAGIRHLRTALSLSPDSPQIMYFLAAALLRLDPASAQEARALLVRCATVKPRPDYPVEDAHYAWQARDLLADLAASSRAARR
ncbi:MAG TPA: hypothetical protein VMX54_13145 [Vicinamibacteria bacterium]|nr:hypothetical protein [Vicinamibacteria bacterium]